METSQVSNNVSLRAGTRVLTCDGVVAIESLENRFFKTRNLNGGWSIASCYKSGVNQPLYKLTLNNGKEYFCAADHKWPVLAVVNNDNTDKDNMPKMDDTENPAPVEQSKTKTVTSVSASDIQTKQSLPYLKGQPLCSPVDAAGTYTDGFCVGLLYLSHTQFVVRSVKQRLTYVWCLPRDVLVGEYGKILTTWLKGIDQTANLSFVEKDDKFSVLTHQSRAFSKHMTQFGVASPSDIKDRTYGLPAAMWTGSEDFRHGFLDVVYSLTGGIDVANSIGYLASPCDTYARDLWDLLGFYGVASTFREAGKDSNGNDTLPHVIFGLDIFSYMFKITNKEKQNVLNKIEHKKQSVIGEIEISNSEPTKLSEDVWSITVYDNACMFALSHCFTGTSV